MSGAYFLGQRDQQELFERDRERFARQIQVWEQKNSAPQSLVGTIVDLAKAYAAEQNRGFQCIGVAVDGGDGMTWSAHSVDRGIGDALPGVQRIRLKGEPGVSGRPELSEVISMRRIAMIAQRHGLVQSVRLLGWRLTAVVVLAALAVGVAGALVTAISKTSVASTSISVRLVIFSAIPVALVLVGQFAGKMMYPDLRTNTLAKVTADLSAQEKGPVTEEYQDFVAELAMQLARFVGFRCVIVDDFGVLDKTTRMALDSYLRYQAGDQSELWIIFYSAADKSLEVLVGRQMRNKPYGYRRTKLFTMRPLSPSQRRELAEAWGTPKRAIFRTVRAITQDPSGLVYLADLFAREHQQRRSPVTGQRAADTLDLFYLISINASCGGNPWLYERDILTNFSRQQGLRSRMLQALLPGRTLSRAVFDAELVNIRRVYLPLAAEIQGEGSERRLRSTAEAGEMLEEKWADFGLADPRVMHIFWTLYWSDAELNGKPDAFFVQEIITHLLRSALPAELDARTLGKNVQLNALAKELFEVAFQCLQACLRYCLLVDVPKLLERAKALAEDGNKEERRRRRRRLRRLTWQAYGLLGDESVLSIALELEPATERVRAASAEEPATAAGPAEGDDQDLVELFLQSMPGASAERRRSMRWELARMDVGRSVGNYAQIRACWLAASAQSFLGVGTPVMSHAATRTHEVLPRMLTDAIDALAVEDEWRTTDILDIALGVWTLTVSTCRDWDLPDSESASARHTALADTLLACYVLADDLAAQRRSTEPDAASLDLVADCLAEDLLTVVFAAGMLFLSCWPQFDGRAAAGWHDVAEIVIESGHSLGVRVPIRLSDEGSSVEHQLITDAERCMDVLAVLWRSMGFRQQASFMTIRHAQFAALALPSNPSVAERVIQILTTDFDVIDHIGLLTHFAAAEGAQFSRQLASQLLLRGSSIARDGNFGEQLVTEICFLALRQAHSFQIGLGDLLEFLVGPCSGAPGTRLNAVLSGIADDDLGTVALILINSISAEAGLNQADLVRAALDDRVRKAEDAGVVNEVNAHLRIFEVGRQQRAEEPIDIEAELNAWENMRDQPSYAFLLSILVSDSRNQTWDRIIGEAMHVFREYDTYLQNSGYVYLAYRMILKMRTTGHSASPEGRRTTVMALRTGLLAWERSLPAEVNINICRLLYAYDSERSAEYERRILQWAQVVLELDEAQRLPRLLDQGRFFLLIWHYFSFFSYYGLRSEPSTDPSGLAEPELSQELAKWRTNRNVIPDPVIHDTGTERLSGHFLARGYALFYPPIVDPKRRQALESELEDGRRQFDEKAKGAIEAVYRMLRSLPRIPGTVERILARHQDLVLSRMTGTTPN